MHVADPGRLAFNDLRWTEYVTSSGTPRGSLVHLYVPRRTADERGIPFFDTHVWCDQVSVRMSANHRSA